MTFLYLIVYFSLLSPCWCFLLQTNPPPIHQPLYASSDRNAEHYVRHWDDLLQEEHRAAVQDLRARRSTWSRRKLEATGVSVRGWTAEPDSELYGEKIIRLYRPDARLKDLYTRGDVLVMTPEAVDRRRGFGSRRLLQQISSTEVLLLPREVCVVDVGSDWLTASVGGSWPAGLWEARKQVGLYQVRLDRTVPQATLLAQKKSLDQVRKGQAGEAAKTLVETFRLQNATACEALASRIPPHLQQPEQSTEEQDTSIDQAIQKAKQVAAGSFQPNPSQEQAIAWALGRSLSLIRGPPGTGKTLCAALLISSAIRLQQPADNSNQSPRVLAVAHSNGAADVLLQALLQMGVPAVRLGRPASVAPHLRHRTLVALAQKHPHVLDLRAQARDLTLEPHIRGTAVQQLNKCLQDVQQTIATTAAVVVASCIGAHQLLSMESDDASPSFSTVVLDEAAQTTEPALLCALAAARAPQVVFVGDTRQLPPTVASDTVELRETLGVSPMARLETSGVAQQTLQVQYRMAPALLQFPSHYFYKGLVTCAEEILTSANKTPPAGFPWPNPEQPIAFVSVGPNLETTHDMGGKSNPTEAELVVQVVRDLVRAQDAAEIAVISPYAKQVQLLRTLLAAQNNVRIGTVDSFQGQETDVVVFSAVRSNAMSEIGFLRDPRRLCVALTRARRGLILVGDPKVLQSSRHWEALLTSCRDRGCILQQQDLERKEETKETEPPREKEDNSDAALVAALEASLGSGDDGLQDLFD